MRIALVCPYAWDRVGGVQTHVGALGRTLRIRGHDVAIFAPRSSRANGLAPEVTLVGRAVGIPANGSIAPLSFGPVAAARIRRALRDFGPDVVHAHEPLIPSLSLLASLAAPAPVVGTFHAAAETSLGYSLARPLLHKAAARLAVRTAVSDEARALVGRYFPGDYLLTPNGIELARYRDAVPSDLGPGRKILFLSRLERRKGLEVLIQACTRLRDLDPTLVVAGTGPEERAARALARELRVPIRWLGRVAEDDKPGVFKGADVYCAPALGGESFGIVLVEAMGSGVPVVCSDLPGFRAVGAGAATLVPPGDAGRLADALRAVLSDEDEARRMGKLGARMAGLYDWERLVGGVEGIYERALRVGTPA